MAMGLQLWMMGSLNLQQWIRVLAAIPLGVVLYGSVLIVSGETEMISQALKEH
jgi:ABC-type enterobactin transport system permease subunit